MGGAVLDKREWGGWGVGIYKGDAHPWDAEGVGFMVCDCEFVCVWRVGIIVKGFRLHKM